VQSFLNFLGLSDIEFVYAEGLNMGEDNKQNALKQAQAKLAELAS
jgi:FMN-dependent NADH-azoreductase